MQCRIWLFSGVPWLHVFLVFCSCIIIIIIITIIVVLLLVPWILLDESTLNLEHTHSSFQMSGFCHGWSTIQLKYPLGRARISRHDENNVHLMVQNCLSHLLKVTFLEEAAGKRKAFCSLPHDLATRSGSPVFNCWKWTSLYLCSFVLHIFVMTASIMSEALQISFHMYIKLTNVSLRRGYVQPNITPMRHRGRWGGGESLFVRPLSHVMTSLSNTWREWLLFLTLQIISTFYYLEYKFT